MIVIDSLKKTSGLFPKGSVVTLGNFDGIHVGHAALVKRILAISKEKVIPSVVITYYPNPAIILQKNRKLKSIISQDLKREIFAESGIDYLVILPFTEEFSRMSAEDFLRDILIESIRASSIVIGFNHRFGKDRRGDFEFLKTHTGEMKFSVEKLDPVFFGDEKISSSLVRESVLQGNMEKATGLLGRNFSLSGSVITGHKRGNTIGFPTANLSIPEELITPLPGVYQTVVTWKGKSFSSMSNIGSNPTFGNEAMSIETYILDFEENLYGEIIKVEFLRRLRDEIKFSSVDDLISQLKQDEKDVRENLSKNL
ncbi:MAG: bifunctional riboflavin kinase/FAD synthetase [Leptospira sp.]|nr:bifunctional riboflavin kinase/FAD synthetase [Leptospira sp.]